MLLMDTNMCMTGSFGTSSTRKLLSTKSKQLQHMNLEYRLVSLIITNQITLSKTQIHGQQILGAFNEYSCVCNQIEIIGNILQFLVSYQCSSEENSGCSFLFLKAWFSFAEFLLVTWSCFLTTLAKASGLSCCKIEEVAELFELLPGVLLKLYLGPSLGGVIIGLDCSWAWYGWCLIGVPWPSGFTLVP